MDVSQIIDHVLPQIQEHSFFTAIDGQQNGIQNQGS